MHDLSLVVMSVIGNIRNSASEGWTPELTSCINPAQLGRGHLSSLKLVFQLNVPTFDRKSFGASSCASSVSVSCFVSAVVQIASHLHSLSCIYCEPVPYQA